jgi:hypothetical protein
MTIEIKIFGFGDDRPSSFQGKNQLKLKLVTPTSPKTVLREAGFDENNDLVLMTNEQVKSPDLWDDEIRVDETQLIVFCAYEGG